MIFKVFSEYGAVSDAHTAHGDDEHSRGFAFATMRTLEDSKKEMEALNEKETF